MINKDYFYFSAFDLEVEVKEMLKYILTFFEGEIWSGASFGKMLVKKMFCRVLYGRPLLGRVFETPDLKQPPFFFFFSFANTHYFSL